MPNPTAMTPPPGNVGQASETPAAQPAAPSANSIASLIPDGKPVGTNGDNIKDPSIPVGKQPDPSMTPADSAVETPFNPPDWRDSLPPELKNEKSIGHINSIEDLVKGYVHAQKAIGADKISVPNPKLATPEDYRAIQEKLGLPKELKEYKIEAKPDAGLDPDFLGSFKENAFKAGVLPKQAQELLDWYANEANATVKQLQDQKQKQLEESHVALRSEWGKAHDRNIQAAQLIVKDYATPEEVQYFQDAGLATDTRFLKFLSRIGNDVKEAEIKGSGGRGSHMKSPAEAQSEANKIIGDMNHPYHNTAHPNHDLAVKEVKELMEMAHPDPSEK